MKVGEQYVCTTCGFNMIGGMPDRCPFCGAGKEHFITSEECSAKYRVQETQVSEFVVRLNSYPPLGIEHAAYRIDTPLRTYWIDCPSSFDTSMRQTDVITFTHHHFLGASNLYREFFPAETWINKGDSDHDLCRRFEFDETFRHDFSGEDGLEAHHIGGHTPGFTVYFYEDLFFVCDYVFLMDGGMSYNPFGPADETVKGGERIAKLLEGREVRTVCGYNYVVPYAEWREKFNTGPLFVGY